MCLTERVQSSAQTTQNLNARTTSPSNDFATLNFKNLRVQLKRVNKEVICRLKLIGALLVAAHPSSKCEHHQPFLAAASSPSAHFSGDLQYNTLLITPLTSSSVPVPLAFEWTQSASGLTPLRQHFWERPRPCNVLF
ncbi:hypothetical protein PtA15_18A99 [Puccinia triticina]|uniref:Uncharacterized protein n=1 Tax=Puccinia triticina TaxID=208348 RepID=A0ABY7D8X3_9BASI|nr:uncharacterized protein PtA15_18A99 [Puccinia triticina]WAQ93043.1 hypothetical protein PtA15_18A99 [Puccinia triticina]